MSKYGHINNQILWSFHFKIIAYQNSNDLVLKSVLEIIHNEQSHHLLLRINQTLISVAAMFIHTYYSIAQL